MKKIVITGPESTGKSSLAIDLARHYGTVYTKEQARTYLNELGRPYEYKDLKIIAKNQIGAEDVFLTNELDLIFCDTDLLTIKIWSEHKYGRVSNSILKWINAREYDLYLLCKPDIPWEPDPLRENPHNRDLLFEKHMDELIHYNKNFEVVEGLGADRFEHAVRIVEKYLKHWGLVKVEGFLRQKATKAESRRQKLLGKKLN